MLQKYNCLFIQLVTLLFCYSYFPAVGARLARAPAPPAYIEDRKETKIRNSTDAFVLHRSRCL